MKLCKVMLIAAASAALALWLKEHVTITVDFGEEPETVAAADCEVCEPETAEA